MHTLSAYTGLACLCTILQNLFGAMVRMLSVPMYTLNKVNDVCGTNSSLHQTQNQQVLWQHLHMYALLLCGFGQDNTL